MLSVIFPPPVLSPLAFLWVISITRQTRSSLCFSPTEVFEPFFSRGEILYLGRHPNSSSQSKSLPLLWQYHSTIQGTLWTVAGLTTHLLPEHLHQFSHLWNYDCHNKLPLIWWLKTTDFFFSEFWRPEVRDQGVSRAVLSPKAPRENTSLTLPFWWLQDVLWFVNGSLQTLLLSSHGLPLFLMSLKRTLQGTSG